MEVRLASVMVDDQSKALAFYVEKLGFVKNKDIPMGGEYRWLTVISPEGVEGVELLLEPMGFAPAATFQRALFDAGIPATADGLKPLPQRMILTSDIAHSAI